MLRLELPPLRARAGDVPWLALELLGKLSGAKRPPEIAEPAMRRLEAYGWPGNVRELENVLRRLVVLNLPRIETEHLPPEILRPATSPPERVGTLREAEFRAIRRALRAAEGNKSKAARLLGIDRNTLYKKLKQMEGPREKPT